eukprot:CAMPEP_0178956100 /NCGR_PEP_ID=MMETSP0789-20121207/10023_1 /TAXON_ID=3005 /ORGANISM="Rhizosolenia setigera, Strain CCMP 1694" /LENGTH=481 /DNA_ID=CAMNT_0020637905 /DNA_START=21 /DNA_END=1466 /DNA_ORIENTATION=+
MRSQAIQLAVLSTLIGVTGCHAFHIGQPAKNLVSTSFSPYHKTTSSTIMFMKEDQEENESMLRNKNPIENMIRTSCVGLALFSLTLFGGVVDVEITPSVKFQPPFASAAVAPLADVGLREFLVKDGKQFLRLSEPTSLPQATLPATLNDQGRVAQEAIELVKCRLEQVGFSGKTPVWNAALKEVNLAKSIVSTPDMLKGIEGNNKKKAADLVTETQEILEKLTAAVRSQDIKSTLELQDKAGDLIAEIRALSLPTKTLPYEISDEYLNYNNNGVLPTLRGRATVSVLLEKAKGTFTITNKDGSTKSDKQATLTMVLDGYRAPITSGNFVDLVQRKYYDDMPIFRTGDTLVETGKKTSGQSTRKIPLELFYKKDSQPTYGYTSDDDMRATEAFSLPFQSTGALGMSYDIEDEDGVNSGTSEFWFLKWDQALVSPGRNTLDGSHACFGYVTENQDLLEQLKANDKIVSMTVVDGSENLFMKKK